MNEYYTTSVLYDIFVLQYHYKNIFVLVEPVWHVYQEYAEGAKLLKQLTHFMY